LRGAAATRIIDLAHREVADATTRRDWIIQASRAGV
jgi:hypothetical protein